MKTLNQEEEIPQNFDYNSVPVFFCKKCLSLNIRGLEDSIDYCDDCGCTEVDTTDIYNWEKLYKEKYGRPFNNR